MLMVSAGATMTIYSYRKKWRAGGRGGWGREADEKGEGYGVTEEMEGGAGEMRKMRRKRERDHKRETTYM